MVLKLVKEKEWFVETPWGKLALIAWGDCTNPPVLMVHGGADCAATFRPLVKLLPQNYYYISIELPGHGRSSPYPPGLMINTYDLVYNIQLVAEHFRWEKFIYIGHSLGTYLGKLYNMAYPGRITAVVELDPTPPHDVYEPQDFAKWYHRFFTDFYDKYEQYNAPKEAGPKYTKEQAIEVLKKRGLTVEAAEIVLERISEPAGDGLLRFTFDQRTKNMTRPPFSSKHMQHLYTNVITTPTLTIVADHSIEIGRYAKTPFVLDEKAYPHGNYRVREVTGNHDVHLNHPERVAGFVSSFLGKGVDGVEQKAKL